MNHLPSPAWHLSSPACGSCSARTISSGAGDGSTSTFNTITGESWARALAASRIRRKTTSTRITMQAFLNHASLLMPGITFSVLADVGSGPTGILSIPADKIPPAVTVVAEWPGNTGPCRAEFLRARDALRTGPRFFATSITNELASIVKGGAS